VLNKQLVINKLPSLVIGNLVSELPIIQGGMAVRVSMSKLAAAVSNEGGIGIVAASGIGPEELYEEIIKAYELSPGGNIGLNVMAAVQEAKDLVIAGIAAGAKLIIMGAGFSKDVMKICKSAGVPFALIISHAEFAFKAERLGASAVIIEGKDAGGHLGTLTQNAFEIYEDIKTIEKEKGIKLGIPAILAGGILNGKDIKRTLDIGASGVQMGSRFALTFESNACPLWKQAVVECTEADIIIIESPVGMPGRALNNDFIKSFYNPEIPKPKIKCQGCLKDCSRIYCILEALDEARKTGKGVIFVGERASEIKDVISVEEVFRRLKKEYEEAITKEGV